MRNIALSHKETKLFEFNALSLDVNVIPLLSKQVHIENLAIDGFKSSFSQQEQTLSIGGVPLKELFPAESPPTRVTQEQVKQPAPNSITIRIDNLLLTKAELKLAYNQQTLDVGLSRWHWQGLVADDKQIRLYHALDTHLAVTDPKAKLALTTQIKVKHGLSADLVKKNLKVTNSDFQLLNTRLDYQSIQSTLAQLHLTPKRVDVLNWNNDAKLDLQFEIVLQQLAIKDDKERTLLNINELSLESLFTNGRLSAQEVTVANLRIRNMMAMEETETRPTLALFKQLTMSNIEMTPKAVRIAMIELGEIQLNPVMAKDKELANLYLPTFTPSEKSVDDEQVNKVSEQSGEQFKIHIGRVRNTSPLSLTYIDTSVVPKVEIPARLNELLIEAISNESKNNETTAFLSGNLLDYGKFELTSLHQLFADEPKHKVELTLSELDLATFSPYLGQALGYQIDSGQLDTQINVAIDNNLVEGDSVTLLRAVELTELTNTNEQKAFSSGAISFNAALGLLKDSDGNVELDIPIDGDLNAPSVGLGGIVSLIIKRATMMAAKDYLMTTFVPYSKIVSIALTAGDTLLKLRFEPLLFEPGKVEINDSRLGYLQQLAEVLQKQSKANVSLCPIATRTDLQLANDESIQTELVLTKSQQETLLLLGQKRSQNVKAWLVEQGNIASKRLFNCAPKVETAPNAQGRLELKQV